MVEIRRGSFSGFFDECREKELYCFGSGYQAEWLAEEMTGVAVAEQIIAFIDNDRNKEGTLKELDHCNIPIISFQTFLERKTDRTVVLVTSMYFADIINQMDGEERLNGMVCYADFLLENRSENSEHKELFVRTKEQVIPKVIHYCWFGKSPIPKEYEAYMDSWRRYCPEYEILRWDEHNYDISKNKFMRQAWDCKKWAFVSDYARLDIVYENGGIYLDTDVELIQNLDPLLYNNMYCGFEQGNLVSTGLGFGAVRGFDHLKKMRDCYADVDFINQDGSFNEKTCPIYNTEYLVGLGMKRNGRTQNVDGITVYSRETLAPESFSGWRTDFTKNTYSVHHYHATWRGTEWREQMKRKNEAIFRRVGISHDHDKRSN